MSYGLKVDSTIIKPLNYRYLKSSAGYSGKLNDIPDNLELSGGLISFPKTIIPPVSVDMKTGNTVRIESNSKSSNYGITVNEDQINSSLILVSQHNVTLSNNIPEIAYIPSESDQIHLVKLTSDTTATIYKLAIDVEKSNGYGATYNNLVFSNRNISLNYATVEFSFKFLFWNEQQRVAHGAGSIVLPNSLISTSRIWQLKSMVASNIAFGVGGSGYISVTNSNTLIARYTASAFFNYQYLQKGNMPNVRIPTYTFE